MKTPLNALKAVFFDLDNVLVFSEKTHFIAWQDVMQQLGIDPALLDFHSLIGVNEYAISCRFQKEYNIPLEPAAIYQMKKDMFLQRIPQGFAFPEGRALFLETASQCINAVVSSSSKHVVTEILKAENLLSHFEFIIAYEDCQKHKPDPEPYLMALELAKVKPENALVIEDSAAGVKAAINANIPVIGILQDQKPEDLIENVTYFKTFSEANAWLTRLR